jgi:NAD(P) transhydrogenase subunit alpha
MANATVGVIREATPGENRVAITPDVAARLCRTGFEVLVESGAGAAAWHSDAEYSTAQATIVTGEDLYERADIVCCVAPPTPDQLRQLQPGRLLVGMLEPLHRAELVHQLVKREVVAVSLDLLPRKLSRAQSMDALSSQANIAGYKAVLEAANAYGRYFPMLTTAAGTSSPASVLVLGTGVAGLSAIGTARRLGAVVTAYDVRPESKGEVESLGAKFLELTSVAAASGSGGYARELTEAERQAQQQELNGHIGRFDIVITTAKVPGRTPPRLVTAEAVAAMRPGSVVLDMAAGPMGGNVAGSQPDRAVQPVIGVTVIGAGNLASVMAPAASTAYARNMSAMLHHLAPDGVIGIDDTDEITTAVVVTRNGAVVNPAMTTALSEHHDVTAVGGTA